MIGGDPAAVAHAFREGLQRAGITAIPWSEGFLRLRERLAFLHHIDAATWPEASDGSLLDRLEQWLAPHAARLRVLERVKRAQIRVRYGRA
jgi:ATP-dependent helicase HrpB